MEITTFGLNVPSGYCTVSLVMEQSKKMLRPSEVEAEYGIPQGTLAYWRYVGIGPKFYRFSARCIRYDVAALESYKRNSEVTPSALAIGGRNA